MFEFTEHTHKRYNPLTGEWILVSPHRTKRPWQGQTEEIAKDNMPEYDPNCYLCPGNSRSGGENNPEYKETFSFVNDFSALVTDIPEGDINDEDLLVAKSEKGFCKVICFSPRHDLTIAKMSRPEVKTIVDLWINEWNEISKNKEINYIQIFENRGAMMGCSNPHPHGQIWANQTIPDIPAKESAMQKKYMDEKCSCLLCDYVKKEIALNERIVAQNDSFVMLVPFWAVWPYETMILPKRHMSTIDQMSEKEKEDLASIMIINGIKFDNLFKTSFPYSMGIHQKPVNEESDKEWHFHFHYYPPLLRSATVKKFMVGYEMMANPQRDITAEQSANILKQLPDIHYTKNN
ncbi:MAG: UDP-glucose--hexose-1-phosphate uridylyltransferase [Spirochaetales bacterium]|nr:UDP-glucose--hexose-1-phosphate uridylyltransferase [Spirochaetales bacterium]